ncbi:MAG: aminoacyl-tRNA hydrolase [Candidatus Krumholzibacteriota bacterium]|nr:aminoacyl-tRNA hydrolase [Candidatus Krumholzibacteriota bacterium]
MSEISFLCGLGNPGEEYASTRHNLGFDTLDLLARRKRLGWRKKASTALVSRWDSGSGTVVLIKPLTYMNLSARAFRFYPSVSEQSLLVICDDINLPLGRLRIRSSGGSGGHKGLESISGYFESDGYPRLRMGVGPSPPGEQWSDFVLAPFADGERKIAESMIEDAADAVEMIVREGIEASQREFNKRPDRR